MADFKTRLNVSISYTDETSVDQLQDTVPLSDAVSRHLTKAFADQFPLRDFILYGYVLPRSYADSVGSNDQAALAVSKPITGDSVGFADAAALVAGKTTNDSTPLTDVAVRSVGKNLVETISLSDAFVLSMSLAKDETVTLADDVSKRPNIGVSDSLPGFTDLVDVVPGTFFNESFGYSDSIAFSVALAFGDEILLGDNADLDYLNGRSFSESMGFQVQFTFASTKSLTESIALAETGLLLMQDYAAEDYFAEDYVVSTTRFW